MYTGWYIIPIWGVQKNFRRVYWKNRWMRARKFYNAANFCICVDHWSPGRIFLETGRHSEWWRGGISVVEYVPISIFYWGGEPADRCCPHNAKSSWEWQYRTLVLTGAQFLKQLGMFDDEIEESRTGNEIRNFTIIDLFTRHNVYYIALKSKSFPKHICRWIGEVKDGYIGYCNKDNFQYFEAKK